MGSDFQDTGQFSKLPYYPVNINMVVYVNLIVASSYMHRPTKPAYGKQSAEAYFGPSGRISSAFGNGFISARNRVICQSETCSGGISSGFGNGFISVYETGSFGSFST